VPDVAFVLDAESWVDEAVVRILAARDRGKQVIGLNVSGCCITAAIRRTTCSG